MWEVGISTGACRAEKLLRTKVSFGRKAQLHGFITPVREFHSWEDFILVNRQDRIRLSYDANQGFY